MNVEPERQERPRPKSAFSFRSNKSDKSASSRPVVDLKAPDSARERRRTRLSGASYADPSRAINEDQPAMRALEQSTLTSIRSLQHKDVYGNPITDADASNPTRSKMERPLDTIRSFEAAIDNGHKKRSQVVRADTAPSTMQTGYSSRRSSWVGNDAPMNPRYNPGGGYNNGYSSVGNNNSRLNSLRHAAQQENYGPSGYPMANPRPQQYQRSSPGPNFHQQHANRMHSDNAVYPFHGYQDSYDTVYTGSSSEPWTNSTDPSSENSSIDRIQAANMKQDYNDAYGGAQPGYPPYGRGSPRNGPIMEEYGQAGRGYPPTRQNNRAQPPQQSQAGNGRPSIPPPPPEPTQAEQYVAQQFSPAQYNGQQLSQPAPPVHQQYPQRQSQQQQPQRAPVQLDKPQPRIPPQQQQRYQQYQGSPLSPAHSRQMWGQGPPPQAPSARYPSQRQGNKLQRQQSGQSQQLHGGSSEKPGEKRKSWLKRAFSKS